MENNWSGSRESRKRPLAEISQSHSRAVSSSPVLVREDPSHFASSSSRLPSLANTSGTSSSSRERRRTPGLHRSSGQPSRTSQSRSTAPMAANSRPAATQRRSEIFIDLTSDHEDSPPHPEPPRRANRMHTSPRPPPTLGRSEARLEQFVDLTADDEEEEEDDAVVITHSRERSVPLNQPPLPLTLPRMPMPALNFGQARGRATPPTLRAGHHHANPMGAPRQPQGHAAGRFGALYGHGADMIMGLHGFLGLSGLRAQLADEQVDVLLGGFGAMPIDMDYGRAALQDHKPEHVAPPPVGDGFTRSPTEADTAICPSCEEELIHRKDSEEPPAKKSRGAPSRKDREEHPFWVIKDCGHVFCNKCFQHRTNDKISSFRGGKNPLCAVEDCESNVRNKDRWVGIFL